MLGLLATTAAALAAKDGAPVASAASVAALSQTVTSQAKLISKLQRQISKLSGGGSCAASDDADPEPELRAFRIAEQQKRAQKRQDELLTLFTAEVHIRRLAALPMQPRR